MGQAMFVGPEGNVLEQGGGVMGHRTGSLLAR
jgi:hypothetical protein